LTRQSSDTQKAPYYQADKDSPIKSANDLGASAIKSLSGLTRQSFDTQKATYYQADKDSPIKSANDLGASANDKGTSANEFLPMEAHMA
jgi:hypothetical protein